MATRASKRKRADTSGDGAPVPAASSPSGAKFMVGSSKKQKTTSTAAKATSKPLARTTSLTLGIPNGDKREPLDVPMDIFYEILSYFSSVPFDVLPTDMLYTNEFYFRDSDALERQQVLMTLSRISRSWREFFLPLAWKTIELATASTSKGQWYTQTSQSLLRAEKGFKEMPHVREYVRGIRVVMSKVSIEKTMPAFVNCLNICPNLETVCVHFAHSSTGKLFKNSFKGLTFPSVTTLLLPTHTHNIVKSFSNVKRLFCTHGDGVQILKSLGPALGKQIELLAGLPGSGVRYPGRAVRMSDVVLYTPNIRELRLTRGFLPHDSNVKDLKNLRRVEVNERPGDVDGPEDPGRAAMVSANQMSTLKALLSDCTVIVHRGAIWDPVKELNVQGPSSRFYIPLRKETEST